MVGNRIILHADFDSFFASCEQQFDPRLRGKPIGVTAEHGRTCIIAASREAKKFGITTGTRSWEAQQKLPEILLVPAHFEKYYEITKKLLAICIDYSPFVEMFSIDEAFIDLTPTVHLFKSAENVAREMKEKIRTQIGEYITITIGVSHNRLLAKLCSTLHKPDGFGIIEKHNVLETLQKIKLTDVCGIGDRANDRLKILGIRSFPDLQTYPLSDLIREFGPSYAGILKDIAFGRDETPVVPYTVEGDVKSVGRNYCLAKNEYDQMIILQTIYELCEEIGIKLRKLNRRCRTVGLFLSGGKSMGQRKTIGRFIHCGQDIFAVCKFLYDSWQWTQYVRRISVWVSNLSKEEVINLSLFDNPKKDTVIKTIDQINDRFGDHTIRNGFLLYTEKLTTKPNGYMADKYERISLAHKNEALRA